MPAETEFPVCAKLPSPVLTVYVNTSDENATRHPRVRSEQTWLQNEAATLRKDLNHADQKLFDRQVQRVHRFLEGRHAAERALIIFSGANCWHVVPLRQALKNELRWGTPDVTPLLLVLRAHRRYGIAVLDHAAARHFAWAEGDMTLLGSKPFEIDPSRWKRKDQGRVGTERVQKARGPQRDLYEKRIEAQYKRLCHDVAEEIAAISKKHAFDGLFLVGSDRLIHAVREKLPQSLANSTVVVPENLGRTSPKELARRLQPTVDRHEQEEQLSEVQLLQASDRGTIANPDEVLTQLQNGRIRRLVVASDLELPLRQCPKCQLATRAADRTCAGCGTTRQEISLLEVLLRAMTTQDVKIEFVNGQAAELLRKTGGLGGWLRADRLSAAG